MRARLARPLRLVALAAAAPLLVTRLAGAQPRDPTTAAELFREGRSALAEKNYAVACPKLAESNRLDPHVGTLISLAECEEATNQLAAARQHWQQGGDLARATGDGRVTFCEERFAAIDPRVPRLTISLAPGAPPGTHVEKDGVEVGSASLGSPLPVEIGHHALRALADGYAPRSFDVDVKEGEATQIVVEPGPALPKPPPPKPTPVTTAGPEPTRTVQGGPPALRIVGYVGTGLGAVALGVGAVYGVLALNGQHPDGCAGDVCNADGAAARKSAIASGNVATVAFIAGGVLAATGIVLWLATPSHTTRVGVQAADGGGVLRLEGRF